MKIDCKLNHSHSENVQLPGNIFDENPIYIGQFDVLNMYSLQKAPKTCLFLERFECSSPNSILKLYASIESKFAYDAVN